jgi:hypothetical protein
MSGKDVESVEKKALNMSRAKVINGRWTRRVSPQWVKDDVWRTDIFKTTLADSRLREAAFVMGSQTVVIPADELRRILTDGADHYSEKIWGPFDIDPRNEKVNRHKVQMQHLHNG